MTGPKGTTAVNDMIFLTGFSVMAIVVAGLGRYGSLTGAGLTAFSLCGFVVAGWLLRRR